MSDGPRPFISILIIVGVLLLFGVVFGLLNIFMGQDLDGNLVHEEGSLEVVFCPTEDCEHELLLKLGNATDIVCAFYDLDLPELISLLDEKEAEVFVFEENAAGLPFDEVESKGLMHHKFCVLDGKSVVTGSMNPTSNGAYKNDNNLLFFESTTLAYRYDREWQGLAYRDGTYRKARSAPRFVNLSGSLVQLQFCPQEPCEERVLAEIAGAEKSIKFMTFSFTSDPIGEALIAAADRGVIVEGVFEARQNPQYSEYEKLKDLGLNVTTDGNSATMHHKVFIIDEEVVITGSYNPTKSANERNDENLLIIHDREIAAEFLSEFFRIWTVASLAAQ